MTEHAKVTLVGVLAAICLGAGAIHAPAAMTTDIKAVDRTVRPGDDFYGYANNMWLNASRLPDGVSRIDTTSLLRAENARRVRALVDEALQSGRVGAPRARPEIYKLSDFYRSLSNVAAIESRRLSPLAGDLAAIARITDRHALSAWLGHSMRLDDGSNQQTESLWGLWVHQGFHDPYHHAAHLVQGGLGLGDATAYLDPSTAGVAARTSYRARIVRLLTLARFDRADARADRILDLETAIARTHASRADTDDVFKTDNQWRRADFAKKAPGVDWDAYLAAAGLTKAPAFVIWQPQALSGGAALVASRPLEVWKDYLAYHLIDHYAAVLPRAVRASEQPSADPLTATELVFGDAIGRLYVERYFPARAKTAAGAMVENLRSAFGARLAASGWMSASTKVKAQRKLAALSIGLGYPGAWTDFSSLTIDRGDAFGNTRRAEAFAYRRELSKLSRRVEPGAWPAQLHPQMVGAILDISPNSIEFAAGLLQAPYFDPDGDAAANYGSAGAGIAHEMTHSFDELGNVYDAQGRLGMWWDSDDLRRYRAYSALFAQQLSGCEPLPGVWTRGKAVVAESASDVGGLLIAYDAYHLSLRGKPDTIKSGLTGDQRFFIAFAQRWRRLQTEAALRQQIATDNHAAPVCRSGLVRNSDAWTSAFGVGSDDRLYLSPGERRSLW